MCSIEDVSYDDDVAMTPSANTAAANNRNFQTAFDVRGTGTCMYMY